MKNFRLKILLVGGVLSLFSHAARGANCAEGGTCGGGINFVGNETVDSYLQRKKMKAKDVKSQVEPELKKLSALLPDFSAELARGIEGLRWYKVDRPLKALPFSRTEIPFETDQGAVQVGKMVYIDGEKLKTLPTREQRKTFLHELVRRVQLRGEGTNVLLTPASALEATNLLMDGIEGKLNAAELKEQLAQVGFSSVPFSQSETKKRELDPDLRAEFVDPTEVKFDIPSTIRLNRAREIISQCVSDRGSGRLVPDSILGGLVIPHIDEDNWDKSSGGAGGAFYDESVLPSLTGRAVAVAQSKPTKTKTGGLAGGALATTEMQWGAAGNPVFQYGVHGVTRKHITVIPAGAFPRFQFHIQEKERLFDDWGLTNTEMKLDRISVIVEKDQWLKGNSLPLKNRETGAVTPLKVDVKQFVGCLQDGFRAEKEEPGVSEKEVSPDGSPAVNRDRSRKQEAGAYSPPGSGKMPAAKDVR